MVGESGMMPKNLDPEGRLKIARRFSAGKNGIAERVPEGRLNFSHTLKVSRLLWRGGSGSLRVTIRGWAAKVSFEIPGSRQPGRGSHDSAIDR
jgi:hypothetical protein